MATAVTHASLKRYFTTDTINNNRNLSIRLMKSVFCLSLLTILIVNRDNSLKPKLPVKGTVEKVYLLSSSLYKKIYRQKKNSSQINTILNTSNSPQLQLGEYYLQDYKMSLS